LDLQLVIALQTTPAPTDTTSANHWGIGIHLRADCLRTGQPAALSATPPSSRRTAR
jgi:hypothetical protein